MNKVNLNPQRTNVGLPDFTLSGVFICHKTVVLTTYFAYIFIYLNLTDPTE